jgi:hypothetical protein
VLDAATSIVAMRCVPLNEGDLNDSGCAADGVNGQESGPDADAGGPKSLTPWRSLIGGSVTNAAR